MPVTNQMVLHCLRLQGQKQKFTLLHTGRDTIIVGVEQSKVIPSRLCLWKRQRKEEEHHVMCVTKFFIMCNVSMKIVKENISLLKNQKKKCFLVDNRMVDFKVVQEYTKFSLKPKTTTWIIMLLLFPVVSGYFSISTRNELLRIYQSVLNSKSPAEQHAFL